MRPAIRLHLSAPPPWLILALLPAAALAVLTRTAPPGFVMPIVCLACFAAAALVALVAAWRHSPRQSPSVTPWDISGALTLIACTAAALSEPWNVRALFDL